MFDTIEETNMDRQDLQDDRRSDLQFGEINEKIIGCAFAREHQAQIGEKCRNNHFAKYLFFQLQSAVRAHTFSASV